MTYFNTYDWSDSIYWNVKNLADATSRNATRNISRFRKHIGAAYTESIGYSASNASETGIHPSNCIISGVDYKAYCDANGKAPRIPHNKPAVLVRNPTLWTVHKTATETAMSNSGNSVDRFSTYWLIQLKMTKAAKAIVDAGGTVDEPNLSYSPWVDKKTVTINTSTYGPTMRDVHIPDKDVIDNLASVQMNDSSVGFLNNSKAYNLVPSIGLKDFLITYQLNNGSPLDIVPIESYNSGINTHANYSPDEVKAEIQKVINFVNGFNDCTLVWSMEGTSYHVESYGIKNTWANITTTLYTDGVKSYRGKSFTDSVSPTGYVRDYDVKYNKYIVTLGDEYTTEDGYTYTTTTLDKGSCDWQIYNNGNIEVTDTRATNMFSTARNIKDATEIKNAIKANGYTEENDIKLQYAVFSVLRRITMELPPVKDHSYHIYMDKAALLKVLTNMYESVRKLDDEYETNVNDVAKNTAIGKLLKDANYLDGLMNTTSVHDLDYMYLSFRINLEDKVNRFNDNDLASNSDEISDLLKRKDIWEYLHVCISNRQKLVQVQDNKGNVSLVLVSYQVPVAYLPNWTRLQKGNNSTAAAVMTAMMKIDNHVHVHKASWWVRTRNSIIGAVIIIVSCIYAKCTGVKLGLAIISAASSIAAAATGSSMWRTISLAASVANMVSSISQPNMTFGKLVKQMGLQTGLQLAQMGIAHVHQQKMKEIQQKIDSVNKEEHEIQELETIVEAREKVKRYITTDQYIDRFSMEYDRLYNIRYV